MKYTNSNDMEYYFSPNHNLFWNLYFKNHKYPSYLDGYNLLAISNKPGTTYLEVVKKNFNSFVEKLSYHYHKTNNSKIIFNCIAEGYAIGYVDGMDMLVKALIQNNVKKEDMLYCSGALPIQKNLENYYELCQKKKLTQIPILLTNYFEYLAKKHIQENNIEFNQILEKKNKKFISMNGRAREHRFILSMLLIKKNLLDKGYYSLDDPYIRSNKKFFSDTFPNLSELTKSVFLENLNKFPMILNKKYSHPLVHYCPDDIEYFNDTYFNIVQETNFVNVNYDNMNGFSGFQYKNIFATEKTFRSIIFGVPFICSNTTNFLQGLKDYGYKTFNNFINESYDFIENDEERLVAIINEVERLCNISDNDWLTGLKDMQEDLCYNFNKLKNSDHFFLLG